MTEPGSSAMFRPLAVGRLRLPNRIVMAPMTRYFSPGGVPTPEVARYYQRRAQGGVGLIVSEGAYIDHPSAHAYEDVPRFYGDDALAGWSEVGRAVHAAGGRIFPQLWHTGPARRPGSGPRPDVPGYAPSAVSAGDLKAMTEEDIADIVHAYGRCAASAMALGFDGVELHGAHGYLIDTFLWDAANRRDDAWGGDLVARTRFAVECVRAVRQATSADFPVSFRWSQFKQQDYAAQLARSPAELERLLGPISDAGATLFHVSTRRFWRPAFPEQSPMSLAGWTRRLTGKPTIAVGSVGLASGFQPSEAKETRGYSFASAALAGDEQFQILEEKLAAGEFDLIAVGRSLLADAEWAAKIRRGDSQSRRPFERSMLDHLR